eukprot:TRINITY_DN6_c0_g2_i1.p1 TRINITY_DN6_c0_g2~~TRINITY_DN6_c0_g2_i1.p1  ORF type:complete len:155 (-),score=14.19 TRINITY_DN6_c0_g2_i1:415-837(-)
MTTGENECLGCRIPAAWIREGKYLHLTSGVNEQNNYYINFLVSLKTWYHVQIKQVENEAKKIVYSILVNNKVIHSLLNTKAREYKNVKVYVADPWYPAANGTIKNIQIITPYTGFKLRKIISVKLLRKSTKPLMFLLICI